MRDIATGQDADFNEDRLLVRYNSELANSVGNLLNRALNMAVRYRGGVLKREGDEPDEVRAMRTGSEQLIARYQEQMNVYQVQAAIDEIVKFANLCNATVEATAPWKLAKDETQAGKLDAILYALAESLRIMAILLSPVIPDSASRILGQLGVADREPLIADAGWGGLGDGHKLGEASPLFPRIESPAPETTA
jgi:methionyl-tRNA synthetase